MKHSTILTKPVFERLVEHLVFIEESADELASFCFPDLPTERENMKQFFLEYARKIEAEFTRTIIVNTPGKHNSVPNLNEFPFVIIGSQVRITNQTDIGSAVYRLIHPIEYSRRKNEVTCLSALGKALLLKEAGSDVVVDTPAGRKRYTIQSIRLP